MLVGGGQNSVYQPVFKADCYSLEKISKFLLTVTDSKRVGSQVTPKKKGNTQKGVPCGDLVCPSDKIATYFSILTSVGTDAS